MNPEHMKRTLMGSLIGVLAIWLALDRYLPSAKPSPADAATAVNAEDTTVLVAPPKAVDPLNEQVRQEWANKAWPANPFNRTRPAARTDSEKKKTGEAARYALSAIVTGRRPLALIDGAYLTIGDRLPDGSSIKAIGQNSVTLQGPDGPWTLTLPE
jgi:hypothetical protein